MRKLALVVWGLRVVEAAGVVTGGVEDQEKVAAGVERPVPVPVPERMPGEVTAGLDVRASSHPPESSGLVLLLVLPPPPPPTRAAKSLAVVPFVSRAEEPDSPPSDMKSSAGPEVLPPLSS